MKLKKDIEAILGDYMLFTLALNDSLLLMKLYMLPSAHFAVYRVKDRFSTPFIAFDNGVQIMASLSCRSSIVVEATKLI